MCGINLRRVLVLGSAAVVNILKPRAAKNLLEYGIKFFRFIESKLRNICRVDVVFDQYLPDRLKQTARQKQGKSV